MSPPNQIKNTPKIGSLFSKHRDDVVNLIIKDCNSNCQFFINYNEIIQSEQSEKSKKIQYKYTSEELLDIMWKTARTLSDKYYSEYCVKIRLDEEPGSSTTVSPSNKIVPLPDLETNSEGMKGDNSEKSYSGRVTIVQGPITLPEKLYALWKESEKQSKPSQDLSPRGKADPVSFYRKKAVEEYELGKQCYDKLKMAYRWDQVGVVQHYCEAIEMYDRRIEQANYCVALAMMASQDNGTTLDLHYYRVPEALQLLDIIIDERLIRMQKSRKRFEILFLITGRGKHSPNNVPKIKPAVIRRLEQRKIKYFEVNAGCLRIEFSKRVKLSIDHAELLFRNCG